jgi:probable phosphoglycerate mutase
MRIFCLRHGQSTYNLRGLCNDDPRDPAHLTGLGRQQAEAAGRHLPAAALDHIYTSPLPRAVETAQIVNRVHGAPLALHPALHDIRSGFNNRPVSEYFAATAHDPLHARVNGGESLLDHKARVLGFIEWLAGQPHRAVLVVAHEETLRVFAARFRNLPDEALRRLAFANGELAEFDLPAE